VTAEELVESEPDLIIGSWCGKKIPPERVAGAAGVRSNTGCAASRHVRDQIVADLATRPGRIDRRPCGTTEDYRAVSSFTYKGRAVDVKQVGRDLGVRYALEGSVRRTGDQVRVNVQLIDVKTGAHLWADCFDTDRAKLAEAQDEITRSR
jgi:hypothetical protein